MKYLNFHSFILCFILFVEIICDDNVRNVGTDVTSEMKTKLKIQSSNTTARNIRVNNESQEAKDSSREHESKLSKNTDDGRKINVQMVPKKINAENQNISRVVELTFDKQKTEFTISDIDWLRGIFNVAFWNPQSILGVQALSEDCRSDLALYLHALRNGSIWADKINDATGKYGTQFFFGNDFWLGSKTLCLQLHNKAYNEYTPPFPIYFFVTKFSLKMSKVKERLISIGLCLPERCSTTEIQVMLEKDAERSHTSNPERSVKIVNVRAVPGPYSLLRDKKLHLLLYILISVIVLATWGTCYEFSLQRKEREWYRRYQISIISNNNQGDIKTIAASPMKMHVNYHLKNENMSDMETGAGKGESILNQLVLSFSIISNSKKILNTGAAPEEALTCVHGLRFLSLLWVILVHTYLQVFTIAENKDLRKLAEKKFTFQTVSNATFSVDTFFFISGMLVTYLYLKSSKNSNRRISNKVSGFVAHLQKFFNLIGYRFLRLTPAYMFVLLIAEISMRWIHNNSVFEPQSQNHISCDKYWWRNILYINNLYPMKDMCMLWSWYVSNDTQFYILGVIILLFSLRYFRFSVIMLMSFLFASWGVTFAVSYLYNYRARIDDPFMLFDELYDKPWTRLGPYLIGMCAGWFIFKSNRQLTLSKGFVLINWFLAIFTLFTLVYGLYFYPLEAVGSSLYVSLGHSAWGIALAWFVVACSSGHGGFIDKFLSAKLFHPLSRLTYCAYLIHPIIMTTTNFQMNAPLHLHDSIVVLLFMGNTVASFLLSFFISLLFEAPAVRLLKLIFSPSPGRKPSRDDTNL